MRPEDVGLSCSRTVRGQHRLSTAVLSSCQWLNLFALSPLIRDLSLYGRGENGGPRKDRVLQVYVKARREDSSYRWRVGSDEHSLGT